MSQTLTAALPTGRVQMQATGFSEPRFPHLRNGAPRPGSDSAWVKDASVQELRAGNPFEPPRQLLLTWGRRGKPARARG